MLHFKQNFNLLDSQTHTSDTSWIMPSEIIRWEFSIKRRFDEFYIAKPKDYVKFYSYWWLEIISGRICWILKKIRLAKSEWYCITGLLPNAANQVIYIFAIIQYFKILKVTYGGSYNWIGYSCKTQYHRSAKEINITDILEIL